jgi:UDP-2,4-diacetamido-2,4,6-trideoxy-beta-L-altropyranose hydrolase
MICNRGFEVTKLAAEPSVAARPDAYDGDPRPYRSWLGAPWLKDAEQTVEGLGHGTCDWLVVDHYAIDACWERKVNEEVRRLFIIDDLADRVHDCHLLLDQNWFGKRTEGRYRGLVPESCRCLLGPQFALIGPEYRQLRAILKARDGILRRLLVFLGGSDPGNQTLKVLHALRRAEFQQLAVDVVLGVNHPAAKEIATFASTQANLAIHRGLDSLAGLMARADLMIGAGGGTSWERMCLGLPAVVIGIAENQYETNSALAEAGYIDFLGQKDDVSVIDIQNSVFRCLEQSERLKAQSEMGRQLVSGDGALILGQIILDGTA